jgi:hypothetical protein
MSWLAAGMLLLAGAVSGPRSEDAASEPVLIHEESDGLVSVESIRVLRVAGLGGNVLLRIGKAGELRYATRAREDRQLERPVALWMRPGVLELGPLPGAPVEPVWLEMAVPPGLEVDLELDGSAVEMAGLRGAVVVRGSRLDLEARGIYGDVVVDAASSEVRIDGVEGDVEIDGEALRLSVKNVSSGLSVALSGGEAEIVDVRGAADLDMQDSPLLGKRFAQGVRLSAVAGRVELHEVRPEADLRLSGTPLVLSGGQGRLTVDSDAEVRFDSVQGVVTVSGYGASVHGSGCNGPIEISTSQGQVVLEKHSGKVHVEGEELTVELRELRGEVSVATTSSEVLIEQVHGPVDVVNDFGDVRVEGTSQPLRIANLNGSVFASGIGGPLELQGSGETFEVGWNAIAGEGPQSILNEQGAVVARLPPNSRCRIEAESTYGTVRSDLPGVRVSQDRRFASGVLGSVQQPVVQIHSAGDVLVTGPGGGAGRETQ